MFNSTHILAYKGCPAEWQVKPEELYFHYVHPHGVNTPGNIAVANTVVKALLCDEKEGYDLTAGMFGPAFTQFVAHVADMREAMQEFVDRVDRGEVRSVTTYNKFKRLLERLPK